MHKTFIERPEWLLASINLVFRATKKRFAWAVAAIETAENIGINCVGFDSSNEKSSPTWAHPWNLKTSLEALRLRYPSMNNLLV